MSASFTDSCGVPTANANEEKVLMDWAWNRSLSPTSSLSHLESKAASESINDIATQIRGQNCKNFQTLVAHENDLNNSENTLQWTIQV